MPVDLDNLKTAAGPGHPLWAIQTECEVWHREQAVALAAAPPRYPGGAGRGIVTVADWEYLPSVWVLAKALRHGGCQLPLQVWHVDARIAEQAARLGRLTERLGATWIDARAECKRLHIKRRRWGAVECKSLAVARCDFHEVMFLDADSYPLRDPTYLWDALAAHTAAYWGWPNEPLPALLRQLGVPADAPRGPVVEGGHLLVDRERHWPAIALTEWMNDHSDYYYHWTGADGVLWLAASRIAGQAFAMPPLPELRPQVALQPDLAGKPLFCHRLWAKFWPEDGPRPKRMHGRVKLNERQDGLPLERECWEWMAELRGRRDALPGGA